MTQRLVIPENVQLALGELGEALMKDGEAKDASISRAVELLQSEPEPGRFSEYGIYATRDGDSQPVKVAVHSDISGAHATIAEVSVKHIGSPHVDLVKVVARKLRPGLETMLLVEVEA